MSNERIAELLRELAAEFEADDAPTDPQQDSGRENGAEPLIEEPPVGTQVVDKEGDIWTEREDGMTQFWRCGEWMMSTYTWDDITQDCGPLRLATDADREQVGLPRGQWPVRMNSYDNLRKLAERMAREGERIEKELTLARDE